MLLDDLKNLVKDKGIELLGYQVDKPEDLEATLKKMAGDGLDLVILASDSFALTNTPTIVKAMNQAKIPTYGTVEKQIQGGAMIGIVSSYHSIGQELAFMVDEILKGKKPSEIPSKRMPFEQLTILVNGKTAEAIEFEIPYGILEHSKILE